MAVDKNLYKFGLMKSGKHFVYEAIENNDKWTVTWSNGKISKTLQLNIILRLFLRI